MKHNLFIIGVPKCGISSLLDYQNVDPDSRIQMFIMGTMVNTSHATVQSVLAWLGLALGRLTQLDLAGRNRTEVVRLPDLQETARRLNTQIHILDLIRRLAKKANCAFQFRKSTSFTLDDAATLRQLQADYVSDNAELSEINSLIWTVWSSRPKRTSENVQQ
jgi:hypothetical protein